MLNGALPQAVIGYLCKGVSMRAFSSGAVTSVRDALAVVHNAMLDAVQEVDDLHRELSCWSIEDDMYPDDLVELLYKAERDCSDLNLACFFIRRYLYGPDARHEQTSHLYRMSFAFSDDELASFYRAALDVSEQISLKRKRDDFALGFYAGVRASFGAIDNEILERVAFYEHVRENIPF